MPRRNELTFEQASLLTPTQLYKLIWGVPDVQMAGLLYTNSIDKTTSISFDCPSGHYDLTHYPPKGNPPATYDVIHVGFSHKTPELTVIVGQVAALFNCKWCESSVILSYRLFEIQSPFMLVFLVLVKVLAAGPDHPWIKDVKSVDPRS